MSDVELTPVREAHKFDAAALESYLNQHVEDFAGPLTIKQFEGCLLYTSPSPRD